MLHPPGILYDSITKRKSRRSFLDKPMSPENFQALSQLAGEINAQEIDLRIVVKNDSSDGVFVGRIGYGMISAKRGFAAIIVRNNNSETYAKAGFYGEWLILEATRRGIDTCWVGGTFNRAAAETLLKLQANESLLIVTPLGEAYPNKTSKEKAMSFLAGSANRKMHADIVKDDTDNWTGWMKDAVEAVRWAPSAMNAQPWLLHQNNNNVTVSVDPKMAKRAISILDCGIAMCHIELAATKNGVHGNWTFSELPDIASFEPDINGGV